MITATAVEAAVEPLSAPGETTRVAPREIRDVAYRAMRVAGASAGEASLAARAVLAAELSPSPDGLAMLLAELATVSSRRVQARFRPGPVPVPVLDDPVRRGLFFSVPVGVEHVLAHPDVTSVLLPGVRQRPGARFLAAVTAGERAAEIQVGENLGAPAGVLIHRVPPGESLLAVAPGTRNDFETAGVLVDAARWVSAQAAARAYLVPET